MLEATSLLLIIPCNKSTEAEASISALLSPEYEHDKPLMRPYHQGYARHDVNRPPCHT